MDARPKLAMEAAKLPDLSHLPTLEVDPNPQPMEVVTPVLNVTDKEAIKEFGRTFHHYKRDSYLMPNDDDEQDRLNLQHYVQFLLLDEKLHKAPLQRESLRRALDMGTGTGIWAIEFAQQYPACNVIGNDLSLIQPLDGAPNCEFVREDAHDEWNYPSPFLIIFTAGCSAATSPTCPTLCSERIIISSRVAGSSCRSSLTRCSRRTAHCRARRWR